MPSPRCLNCSHFVFLVDAAPPLHRQSSLSPEQHAPAMDFTSGRSRWRNPPCKTCSPSDRLLLAKLVASAVPRAHGLRLRQADAAGPEGAGTLGGPHTANTSAGKGTRDGTKVALDGLLDPVLLQIPA